MASDQRKACVTGSLKLTNQIYTQCKVFLKLHFTGLKKCYVQHDFLLEFSFLTNNILVAL